MTSLAPETSCLVAMEALASGTPVVALRVGALPEIVDHGETGLLVDRVEDLPEAIARVREIDPAACRRAAETRFHAGPMCARYLDLYRALAAPAVSPARRAEPEVAVVTRIDRLRGLEPEWRRLWRSNPEATPFEHPAWVLAAAEVFPPDALVCVTARRGGALAGVAAMGITDRELHPVARALSDYVDALVEPRAAASFGRALSLALVRMEGWDRATLGDLPEGSVFRHAPALPGCSERSSPANVCPVIDLAEAAGRRPRQAKDLEQQRRRCARMGVRIRRVEDLAEAHRTIDDLVRLHGARWRARDQPGALSEPCVQRFHHLAVDGLHADGIARLYRLDAAGRCLAVLYALVGARRICFYLSGFDPEARALSPGTLLIGRALDDARAEGKRYFDFLRGREPYKYAWGAQDRVTWLRSIERGREEAIGSWRSSECGGRSVT